MSLLAPTRGGDIAGIENLRATQLNLTQVNIFIEAGGTGPHEPTFQKNNRIPKLKQHDRTRSVKVELLTNKRKGASFKEIAYVRVLFCATPVAPPDLVDAGPPVPAQTQHIIRQHSHEA